MAQVVVTIYVARPKFQCERGFGICKIVIVIGDANNPSTRAIIKLDEENQKADLEFLNYPPNANCSENIFYIDEDKELPHKAAQCLGFKRVTLLRGEYEYDTCISQYGTVKNIMVKLERN
ncbi:MAG: hypothetical protein AB1304_07370 [Bacteroidota bacterium]